MTTHQSLFPPQDPQARAKRPTRPRLTARAARNHHGRLEQNHRMAHRKDEKTLEQQLREAHELLSITVAALELLEIELDGLEGFVAGVGLFADVAGVMGL